MYLFSVLTYCNAAPLVHFIGDFCRRSHYLRRTPKEMLIALQLGGAHAALLPTFDFLMNPGLKMVPGLGICADGPVESVLLKSRCPLNEIRSIALSPESRTSNNLVQVLLREHCSSSGRIRFAQDNANADAYVVIGDRAFHAEASRYTYDLSEMWHSMTGLPFVFAVWAYPGDSADSRVVSILRRAKDKGCQNIAELSQIHAARLGLSPAYVRHYLTACINYDVGERETEAMRRFHDLLRRRPTHRTLLHQVNDRQKAGP